MDSSAETDIAGTSAGPVTALGDRWLSQGLSEEEAAARAGRTVPETASGRSLGQILRRNAFTRLNFLLCVLGAATLVTGSAPDATFLAIALINTVVGAVQELRAKRTLDALAVINAPHARVIRDGQVRVLQPEEVVVDDLLDLRSGDQLTADAVVVTDTADFDESLATGESEPVTKGPGSELISGTWVVAGSVLARAVRTGGDSYANRLAGEARRFSLASSELMRGINLVLKWLTWIMVLLAPILFLRQLQSQPWRMAIRLAVAGLVGMIPEGLVLLTTLAFLAAAVRLGRRRVLVQELPAVETLARVDALCADKTGTLTEGTIGFAGLDALPGDRAEVSDALASLAAIRGANATMTAIGQGVGSNAAWTVVSQVPFSSARKWSGAVFEGHGAWILGAPEMVTGSDPHDYRGTAGAAAAEGARALVVARGGGGLTGETLPADLQIVATVELQEKPRTAVKATLRYFDEQGVTVRVISGDAPSTVQAVARRVGLSGADRALDARTLSPNPVEFTSEVEEGRIFGRVTPEQKRNMVNALQLSGHSVAMTGDGVNDVLALKDADLGIAMGSGSSITRGVAQLVLLDDDFDVLPSVVGEGRRVLSNIEIVACLFLVKNVYSFVISTVTAITGWPYPFLPRHLTLISAVGIGIPGFFLALAPNERRFVTGFLRRALTFSILAGSLTAAAVICVYGLAREEGLSGDASRTAAIIATIVVTLWVLVIAARPLTPLRLVLVIAMGMIFVGVYLTPGVNTFFNLEHRPSLEVLVEALVLGVGAAVLIDLIGRSKRMRRLTGRNPEPRAVAPEGPPATPA
jgi:cation-transporting P-type ATPase E